MVDAESVLIAWLRAAFPTARICTETPDNLADVLPCIQVRRFGGIDDEIPTFDNANIDFDCFESTYDKASALAHDVRSSIRNDLPGQTILNTFASRARTFSGPSQTPYDNTNLRRFTYSAQIRLHSLEA